MGVCPLELVIHVLQQPLGLSLSICTIDSHQGGQVELKGDIHAFQLFVILRLHIDVPLWVRQYGDIAFLLDAQQNVVHAIRRIEVGGLYQQVLAFLAQRQQVALRQTFLEQVVKHVLRGQAQDDGTLVG